jgi:hypothetical protein
MSAARASCSRTGGSLEPQALRSTTMGSRLRGSTVVLVIALALTACATQVSSAVSATATSPGFLLGLWHGFIFPVAWVLSLFMPDVAVYAVPNNGGWYDFGYFLGIVVFGVGARKTRTVYVTRRVRG